MRKVVLTALAVSIAIAAMAVPAAAFEGGGRKPSEAPLITLGQHYTGQLNNHKDDANYEGAREVAFWRLPPLAARDVVTVDWHGLPFTKYPGQFPLCLVFGQGIDDFNWGGIFNSTARYGCSEHGYSLTGSGTARTQITAQETNPSSSYLEFWVYSERTNPADYETFPYDFTVGPVLHYLGVALGAVKRVSATGYVHASATLATGAPAPDGLPFTLAVSWPGGGTASYAALSSGGGVTFALALPETAYGKSATFVVSHPPDAQYQGATSPKLVASIAKPKPPGPTPCEIASRRRNALARQYNRLSRHARHARGPARYSLRRRAARAKRRLNAARSEAASLCTAARKQTLEPEHPVVQSATPPDWVRSSSHCEVDLLGPGSPSGLVGYVGYNVSSLKIARRSGVGCADAKRYAQDNWVSGAAGEGLHWRYLRAWRSPAGSAYVGQFVGSGDGKRIEYLAIH